MTNKCSKEKKEERGELLLSFISRTKDGNYSPIDESSLPYSRIVEERENTEQIEEFYYSIS